MVKKLISITLTLFTVLQLFGQQNNCLTVHLVRKSEKERSSQQYNINDFYIQRNCIYDFVLQNDRKINVRLINIKPDTLVFLNYFNKNVAKANNDKLDTLKIRISELKEIKLIADRTMGIYESITLSDYFVNFVEDCNNSLIMPKIIQIYTNDTAKYEVLPFLTSQGYDYLFEKNGRTFYYRGQIEKNSNQKRDTIFRKRNIAWYTPCAVEEINGIAIGLFTENMKNSLINGKDSLKIRGLNLELMPFGFVWILSGTIFNNPELSMDVYDKVKQNIELKIYGVNISLSGTVKNAKLCGLNISGISTSATEIHGLSISGFNTFSFKMNGVSISTAQNVAVQCRGVQIGLFNRAKDLKGIQIGLWNNNGKFSLPIINLRL